MSQTTPCETIRDLVLWALDEAPPAPEQRLLESHLAECPACRAYQQSMEQLTGSLRGLESVVPPADLADRVMAQVQSGASRRGKPQAGGQPFLRRYLSVAAAVLLLALAIPLIMQGLSGHDGKPGGQVASVKPRLAVIPSIQPTENPTQPEEALPNTGQQAPPTTLAQNPGTSTPVSGLHEPVTATIPPASTTTTVEASTAYDQVEVAMAHVTEDMNHQGEDDIYYDPMSELVGF